MIRVKTRKRKKFWRSRRCYGGAVTIVNPAGRPPISVEDYQAYLRSEHWRRKRTAFFRYPRTCYACGAVANLHAHHTTYRNLGKERFSDLVAACADCHKLIHRVMWELNVKNIQKATDMVHLVITKGKGTVE